MKKSLLWAAFISIVVLISVAGAFYYLQTPSRKKVVVSTTTSLYDTGLLDAIEDRFEAEYPIDLFFISVGTGQAIQQAERGDADVLLVHDPSRELQFLESGFGVCRKIIAYNFFIIVGPDEDPAGIEGLDPLEAMSKIALAGREGEATWVSRGDDSGTHAKEKSLWLAAGYDWEVIREEAWYRESGTGMGNTLQIANELEAYTLSDAGTYLKYFSDHLIVLKTLVDQGEELLNVYSVIAVNVEKHPNVNFEGAIAFIKFLISEDGQGIIESYGKEMYGQSLFYPTVDLLEVNTNSTLVQWIRGYAFFDGSECPPEYRDDHPELYP